jgi:drug/metabolite transporter (DMT)-like permease
MNPQNGLFGWFDPLHFLYIFFVMGLICRVGTQISYTYALYSFSPVIVTNAMLSEPLISQILAISMGLDNMPGIFTFVGMFITCCGIVLLSRTLTDGKEV